MTAGAILTSGVMVSRSLLGKAEEAAQFLTVMGNPKRLAIMSHLLHAEMSVGAIAAKVDLSQSALSQHLAKLRGMGLVETRRERQMIYYSSNTLLVALDGIFREEPPPAP
jgi:DNA-binding transcriptional ArsR family regulator